MIKRAVISVLITGASIVAFAQEADSTQTFDNSSQSIRTTSSSSHENKKAKPLEVKPTAKSNWSRIKDLFL
ncbi:MAG: hypothetical protein GF401_17415 [Chitinivibrionales bacterium]|nr:hypothetical protein [Chitinivibrionales bacterium]